MSRYFSDSLARYVVFISASVSFVVLLVPAVREIGGNGFSVLAASIVLMAMVLPTIISISEDSIRAVPSSYIDSREYP